MKKLVENLEKARAQGKHAFILSQNCEDRFMLKSKIPPMNLVSGLAKYFIDYDPIYFSMSLGLIPLNGNTSLPKKGSIEDIYGIMVDKKGMKRRILIVDYADILIADSDASLLDDNNKRILVHITFK